MKNARAVRKDPGMPPAPIAVRSLQRKNTLHEHDMRLGVRSQR